MFTTSVLSFEAILLWMLVKTKKSIADSVYVWFVSPVKFFYIFYFLRQEFLFSPPEGADVQDLKYLKHSRSTSQGVYHQHYVYTGDVLLQNELWLKENKSRQKLYPISSSFILFASKHQLHYNLPFNW